MSSYENVWRALAELITEFRRRNLGIPPQVMDDLRSAKTLIEVLKLDPSVVETTERIEGYLRNVESYLLPVVQNEFEPSAAEEWMRRVEEAWRVLPRAREAPIRFVPGLPRGQHWVRIRVEELLNVDEVGEMAEEEGVSWRIEEDGYVLVYGEGTKVKSLIKRIAKKLRNEGEAV
ncbi:hypothetical protein DRO02_08675 [archaeon]|nr:MAG: hypothetical protein DRO02_08675 [archaeon]